MLRIFLSAAALPAAVVLFARLDADELGGALLAGDPEYLVGAFLVSLAYLLARAARLFLLARALPAPPSLEEATRLSCIGALMAGLAPGLGEASRIAVFSRRGSTIGAGAAVVLQERALDGLSALLLGVAVLLGYPIAVAVDPWVGLAGSAAAAIVIGGVVCAVRADQDRFCKLRFAPPAANGIVVAAMRSVFELRSCLRSQARLMMLRPPLLVAVVTTTAICQALSVGAAWCAIQAFGLGTPILAAAALVTVVNLGLGLAPTPLGLGLYQIAGLITLAPLAGDAALAIAAATAFQACTYAALFAAGAPAWLAELNSAPPSSASNQKRFAAPQ